ncbi:GNAT family N-acetyltransferase [Tessaracoccus sp. O5.2]|uniref:GNAT family N-acetyltransferase n=1 Tax=Tessaracoccus sp. O5.2 TaxID=3157622 RepID=UPI0036DA20FE
MLRLQVPSRDEFALRQAWLLDPEMMAYNAGWQISHAGYDPGTGCIDWPEDDWPAFEARLAQPASQQGYYFVQEDETSEFLGHVHYELHTDGAAHIGLNVIPARRGSGLGMRFMNLLLERVWQDTEAAVAINEFEDGRLDAVRLHRRCGFVPDPTTSNLYGRPTRTWRLLRSNSQ